MSQIEYRLVVDTSHYAGNFERQSIAYATGMLGECGVGKQEELDAREEVDAGILDWWEAHTIQVADDHGVLRPAAIHPTLGFFNHGMGESFPTTDEGRADGLIGYHQRMREHHATEMTRLENVPLGKQGWTAEAQAREIASANQRLATALALTKPHEYPSYQSVAIMVDQVPPPDVVASFSSRMRAFLENRKITVLGMHMETQTTTVEVSKARLGP